MESKLDRRQTMFHSLLPLIFESTQDKQTDKPFHFTPQIGIYARQTDGQTTFHFTPHIGIYARQTDGHTAFYFIPQTGYPSKTNRRTN